MKLSEKPMIGLIAVSISLGLGRIASLISDESFRKPLKLVLAYLFAFGAAVLIHFYYKKQREEYKAKALSKEAIPSWKAVIVISCALVMASFVVDIVRFLYKFYELPI